MMPRLALTSGPCGSKSTTFWSAGGRLAWLRSAETWWYAASTLSCGSTVTAPTR